MFNQEWDEARIARHLAAAAAVPYGLPFLDDALGRIFQDDLILIGGRTGRGKTELATALALSQSKAGRHVTFFALEASRWEIHNRMTYRALSKTFFEHYASASELVWPDYLDWLTNGFDRDLDGIEKLVGAELAADTANMRIVYTPAKFSPDAFVEKCEEIMLTTDTDLFVIDHLHYFDLGPEQSETDGLKRCVHTIRDLAIKHEKPVILLGHLRKADRFKLPAVPDKEDFHGHGDIVKVATVSIMIAPAPEIPGDSGTFPTYFHVGKCRKRGNVDRHVGILTFDQKLNTYKPGYYLAKYSRAEVLEPISHRADVPRWAKNAKLALTPLAERESR
jgi:hypothetical protein